MGNGNRSQLAVSGCHLRGGLDEVDERGQPVNDQNFLLLMNAHHDAIKPAISTSCLRAIHCRHVPLPYWPVVHLEVTCVDLEQRHEA
jgi:hypothetical protein